MTQHYAVHFAYTDKQEADVHIPRSQYNTTHMACVYVHRIASHHIYIENVLFAHPNFMLAGAGSLRATNETRI